MTNVLKDIANTPLEQCIKYVALEFKCSVCGHIETRAKWPINYTLWLKEQSLKAGCTWTNRSDLCHCETQPITWVMISVTPSKNQEND